MPLFIHYFENQKIQPQVQSDVRHVILLGNEGARDESFVNRW
jgi:hypothetical protein